MIDGSWRRLVGSVSALAVTLVAGAHMTAQERQLRAPRFGTTVEIVQLQVRVTGPEGEFVSGLAPEDFRLRIDGEPRPVQVAYEVDLRGEEPRAVAVVDGAPRSRERLPVAARRHFLLFFDLGFNTRRGILEAREAALGFLRERVRPTDMVGVATYDRFGLSLLSPFTTDHERAVEAVGTLGLADVGNRVEGGIPFQESIAQALAEMAAGPAGSDGGIGIALSGTEFREYVARVEDYAESLQDFGRMLQAIEGRKHVILFSRGFDDRAFTGQSLGELGAGSDARAADPGAVASADPEMMYGSAAVRGSFREMVDALREADAVVHAVDPSGLRGLESEPGRQTSPVTGNLAAGADLTSGAEREGRQALTAIADATGGTASWNMNDVGVALARLEEETSSYYVIGYRKRPEDAATVRVEVEVDDARVAAASRLTPPPAYDEMTPAQRQLQLAEFLADDVDRLDIAFDLRVVPLPRSDDAGALVLMLQVPGSEILDLATQRGGEEVELEIAAFALDEQDGVAGSIRRRIRVDAAAIRARGAIHEQAVHLSELVSTAPGSYRVRVLLREAEVGRLSSRTTEVRLASMPRGLELVPPLILTSGEAPSRPASADGFDPLVVSDRAVSPQAAPVLSPGGAFRLLLLAYNLPRDPATGDPDAGVVIVIEGSDGSSRVARRFDILGSQYLDGADLTQIVVEGVVPPDVEVGSGRIHAAVIAGSGERAEAAAPLFLAPRGSR